eukprot:TRINITY_DN9581_c0_g1_i1.p1 TRINITY_DN9581_c0_g1~~TRINITY_DN9581_c0_g1_i1.p1  ORF type:complete len:631 (+),score=114.69 TRINITY_DN9581_c0_g1_i1:263-1894(+)
MPVAQAVAQQPVAAMGQPYAAPPVARVASPSYSAPVVTAAPVVMTAVPGASLAATTRGVPAAPQVTYAAPVRPYAAPTAAVAGTSIPSYTAPVQYVQSAPAVVAAPMQQAQSVAAFPAMLHPGNPPQMPPKLTEGMSDPASIEHVKGLYSKGLDEQLEQGIKIVEQQNAAQKQALREQMQQQKQRYDVQVDAQLKQQELTAEQETNYKLMNLQAAAHEHKAMLEQQANQAVLEYHQRKVQDDFASQQYEYQRKAYEKQIELQRDLQAEMMRHQQQMTGGGAQQAQREACGSYAAPPPQSMASVHSYHGGSMPQAASSSYTPAPMPCAGGVPPATSYSPASYVPPPAIPPVGSSYALPPPPPNQFPSAYSSMHAPGGCAPGTSYNMEHTQNNDGYEGLGSSGGCGGEPHPGLQAAQSVYMPPATACALQAAPSYAVPGTSYGAYGAGGAPLQAAPSYGAPPTSCGMYGPGGSVLQGAQSYTTPPTAYGSSTLQAAQSYAAAPTAYGALQAAPSYGAPPTAYGSYGLAGSHLQGSVSPPTSYAMH